MIKLDDFMPFGKHKGKIVRRLAQTNYNYILWCAKELKTVFSEGVLYIARQEAKSSVHRQLCWSIGQRCEKRWKDWSEINDENPKKKNVLGKKHIQNFDVDDESIDFDEYGGMDYSDFGNN